MDEELSHGYTSLKRPDVPTERYVEIDGRSVIRDPFETDDGRRFYDYKNDSNARGPETIFTDLGIRRPRAAKTRVVGRCPAGGTAIQAEYEDDDWIIGRCTCGSRWWFALEKKKKPPKEKGPEYAHSVGRAVCPCHSEPLEVPYSERDAERGTGKCPVSGEVFEWASAPGKEVNKFGEYDTEFVTARPQ